MSQPSPPSSLHLTDDVVDVSAVSYLDSGFSFLPAYFKNTPWAPSFETSESALNLLVGPSCLFHRHTVTLSGRWIYIFSTFKSLNREYLISKKIILASLLKVCAAIPVLVDISICYLPIRSCFKNIPVHVICDCEH